MNCIGKIITVLVLNEVVAMAMAQVASFLAMTWGATMLSGVATLLPLSLMLPLVMLCPGAFDGTWIVRKLQTTFVTARGSPILVPPQVLRWTDCLRFLRSRVKMMSFITTTFIMTTVYFDARTFHETCTHVVIPDVSSSTAVAVYGVDYDPTFNEKKRFEPGECRALTLVYAVGKFFDRGGSDIILEAYGAHWQRQHTAPGVKDPINGDDGVSNDATAALVSTSDAIHNKPKDITIFLNCQRPVPSLQVITPVTLAAVSKSSLNFYLPPLIFFFFLPVCVVFSI